ncbi:MULTISPECIES: hypothetical protein [Streptomyces]|nr:MULTISPECIES: hypothetical protein [Streptomyces]MBK3522756.1 hypothetical protein [Streptomyces sp. MBT70]
MNLHRLEEEFTEARRSRPPVLSVESLRAVAAEKPALARLGQAVAEDPG